MFFKYISDIHLVNICKKRYDTIIDKLQQEELICKRTYAKKETLSIINNMQQLPKPEAGLENRNENLKEDILHIRSEFVELKAFIESQFIDIKNYAKKNIDNSSSTSQFERLVYNMEAEIVFLRDEIESKNKIINNLLGNFSKSQNLSYNDSNKTFYSSEKVLISHDYDITMEPQEAVKKKQSTNNRSNKSRLSKRDNSKRSQDNDIAIVKGTLMKI